MGNSITLELLSLILKHKSGDVVDSMFNRGIIYKINYGVNTPIIKRLVEPYFGDHELAEELFAMDYREAKLAAIYIESPEALSVEQMERWSADFINNEIVEQAVISLFWKSKFALYKASEWVLSENEYLQKAGLMMVAKVAAGVKEVRDDVFEPYFNAIEAVSETTSPHARSAAAYALREIGKRNKLLNTKAVNLAKQLGQKESTSAKWIAEDVLWTLIDDDLQRKLV